MRRAADGQEGETAEGQTYRTQALRADATAPGPWHHLAIDGERWVYAATAAGDKNHPLHERTLNLFAGPDGIHFDIQTSKDGATWVTTLSGDERRAPWDDPSTPRLSPPAACPTSSQ